MADLCGGCRSSAAPFMTWFSVPAAALIFTQGMVRLADGLPRHAGARPPVVA